MLKLPPPGRPPTARSPAVRLVEGDPDSLREGRGVRESEGEVPAARDREIRGEGEEEGVMRGEGEVEIETVGRREWDEEGVVQGEGEVEVLIRGVLL